MNSQKTLLLNGIPKRRFDRPPPLTMLGLLKEGGWGWHKGRLRKSRAKNGVPSVAPGSWPWETGMAQMQPAGGGRSGGPKLSLTPGAPLVEHSEDVILNQLAAKGCAQKLCLLHGCASNGFWNRAGAP